MVKHVSDGPVSYFQFFPLLLTFCTISAFLIYKIYTQEVVYGSTALGWIYPYVQSIKAIPLWIPFVVLLFAAILHFGGVRLIRSHEKSVLVVCFLLAFAVQVLIQSINPQSLESIVTSDRSNSFYSVASQYSPREILSHYEELTASLPLHARTNMPGKILLYQGLMLLTTSPLALGYLLIAISSSGGLILYGICKRLFSDHRIALYAFTFYLFIPGKLAFLPILNTVTPVFILLCMYLFVRYLNSRSWWFLVLLGIALYALILFEPSPLVTGVLFVGIFLHALGQGSITLKDGLRIVLTPAIAFTLIHLLMAAFFSFDLISTLGYVLKDAVAFNSSAERGYFISLRENMIGFFYAAGLPTMMIVLFTAFHLVDQWKNLPRNWIQWPLAKVYLSSLVVDFIILLLLGINRGEITRLWIYMAVFFQIPAAVFLAKESRGNLPAYIVIVTLAVQSMIMIQRITFILP